MEGKTKVKVKFGKTRYWEPGEPGDAAIRLAIEDAKARLVSAFPQVEDIQAETKISSCTNPEGMGKMGVKASAFGYVPKSNKTNRYLVKDIKTTKLYQSITKQLEEANETVVAYAFRYNIKYTKYPYVEFTGKGEIPWTQVQEAINANNQAASDPIAHKEDWILVKPNDLYVDTLQCYGVWRGSILLSDGSWLEISELYNSYEDGYYTAIKRRFPPKVEIPDVSFKASVNTLVSLPDNYKEEVIKIVNTNVKEESDGK